MTTDWLVTFDGAFVTVAELGDIPPPRATVPWGSKTAPTPTQLGSLVAIAVDEIETTKAPNP